MSYKSKDKRYHIGCGVFFHNGKNIESHIVINKIPAKQGRFPMYVLFDTNTKETFEVNSTMVHYSYVPSYFDNAMQLAESIMNNNLKLNKGKTHDGGIRYNEQNINDYLEKNKTLIPSTPETTKDIGQVYYMDKYPDRPMIHAQTEFSFLIGDKQKTYLTDNFFNKPKLEDELKKKNAYLINATGYFCALSRKGTGEIVDVIATWDGNKGWNIVKDR